MSESTEPSSTDKPEQTTADKTADQLISVKIYAPFQVYYEGRARSLSAVNDVGPFDILPGHHNFLCMLVPCEIKVDIPDKGVKKIRINRALMHVKSNHTTVFVDV